MHWEHGVLAAGLPEEPPLSFNYNPDLLKLRFFLFVLIFFTPKTFCNEVYLVNNVVRVSGEQQRNSALHIHTSVLPKTPLSSELPHDIVKLRFFMSQHRRDSARGKV